MTASPATQPAVGSEIVAAGSHPATPVFLTAQAIEGDAIARVVPLWERVAILATLILPVAGLAAAAILLWGYGFSWTAFGALMVMYVATGCGIGVGYHRLFTHRSFETSAPVKLFWGILGSMAIEGPVISWVAVHRQHHQHSDRPGDPHSPHVDEHGHEQKSFWGGLWSAHLGWLFHEDVPDVDRYAPDLKRDPVVAFVDRTFLLWVFVGLAAPALVCGLIMGSWMGALLGFIWGGLVRVFLVHHITWGINSVCHVWGTRPFLSRDESRNNPVLGLLAFGEGWHNAHHAFPTSARHGLRWWEVDINYIIIKTMQVLGLVRAVRVPSPERIKAQTTRAQMTKPN